MEISEFTGDGMRVIKTKAAPGESCGYAYRRRRIDVTVPAETDPIPIDRNQLLYVLPSPLGEGDLVSFRTDARMIDLSELSACAEG